MDLVTGLLAQFGTLAVCVWAILQMLPSREGSNYKLWLSFVLGAAFGVIGHGVGLVDLGGLVKDDPGLFSLSEELKHTIASGFLGVLATVMAKVGHDFVVNPLLKRGNGAPTP